MGECMDRIICGIRWQLSDISMHIYEYAVAGYLLYICMLLRFGMHSVPQPLKPLIESQKFWLPISWRNHAFPKHFGLACLYPGTVLRFPGRAIRLFTDLKSHQAGKRPLKPCALVHMYMGKTHTSTYHTWTYLNARKKARVYICANAYTYMHLSMKSRCCRGDGASYKYQWG
jgi:hypothetical protein